MSMNKLKVNSITSYTQVNLNLSSQRQRPAMKNRWSSISQLGKLTCKSSLTSANGTTRMKRQLASLLLLLDTFCLVWVAAIWGVNQKHTQAFRCLYDSDAGNQELKSQEEKQQKNYSVTTWKWQMSRWAGNLGRRVILFTGTQWGGRRETRDTNDILGRTILHRLDCSMHCMLFSIPGPPHTHKSRHISKCPKWKLLENNCGKLRQTKRKRSCINLIFESVFPYERTWKKRVHQWPTSWEEGRLKSLWHGVDTSYGVVKLHHTSMLLSKSHTLGFL